MTLADLVVHRVVTRRDLERPRAETLVDRLVAYDRQPPADQRQDRGLPDQRAIPVVGWIDRDSGVDEHRLRPHRGDHDFATILNRIFDVVERVLVHLPVDLEVGDGGQVVRAPVDDARPPVDPAAFVERDKRRHNCPHVPRVHREPQARPIKRDSQDAVLAHDGLADFEIPLVHSRSERVPPELLFRHSFCRQLLLDHVLRRDRRVVGAREVKDLVARHPAIARADVLHRVVERVTHVQSAGDVRGRQADGVLRFLAVGVGREQAVGLPSRVPAGLYGLGIEGFRHCGGRVGFCLFHVHRGVFDR